MRKVLVVLGLGALLSACTQPGPRVVVVNAQDTPPVVKKVPTPAQIKKQNYEKKKKEFEAFID